MLSYPLVGDDPLSLDTGWQGMDLGESHTFQYTIDISPPPKKKKTKPTKKPKVKKPPKPKVTKVKPKAKKPPKSRIRLSPEERAQRRRAYEKARSQLPHRRELMRRQKNKRHRQAKELGLCRTCRNPAVPGQTRCQDCVEKHRLQRIQAKEKAAQQKHETLGQHSSSGNEPKDRSVMAASDDAPRSQAGN